MKILEKLKRALLFPLIGIVLATSALSYSTPVYADPVDEPEAGTVVPGAPEDRSTDTGEGEEDEKEKE